MSNAQKALSTAKLIGTVKVGLVVANALASVVFILGGINISTPDFLTGERNPLATPMIIGGILALVFGTLVIVAVFGFFQYLLATNAELLVNAELMTIRPKASAPVSYDAADNSLNYQPGR